MEILKDLITERIVKTFVIHLLVIFCILSGVKYLFIKDQPPIVKQYTIIQDINFPADFKGSYVLTAYCPCRKCVGRKKIVRTSTGLKPTVNRTIAVDPTVIPYGSIVYIEGLGYYIAEDCGGNIKNNRIDIYVATHEEAVSFGKQNRNVWIMEKEN